jgi:hypothetical protein
MKLFREAMTQPEQNTQPKQKPDREADPFEYMAWQDEQLEGLRSRLDQFTTQTQERDAYVALHSAYTTDARTFARANADFSQAYNWPMTQRDAELQAAGYTDPEYRKQVILSDERDLVARALHARQSNANAPGPAQLIYGLAKARGFAGATGGQRGAAAQRSTPAAQSGGFDLARIAELTDGQYFAWKRGLSPQQRKSYAAALGG